MNQPKMTVELVFMCPLDIWSSSSDAHQEVEIQKDTSAKMDTPFKSGIE